MDQADPLAGKAGLLVEAGKAGLPVEAGKAGLPVEVGMAGLPAEVDKAGLSVEAGKAGLPVGVGMAGRLVVGMAGRLVVEGRQHPQGTVAAARRGKTYQDTTRLWLLLDQTGPCKWTAATWIYEQNTLITLRSQYTKPSLLHSTESAG